MNKQTIIDKFLKDKDLKEYELVYWKHKVSNGFKLKKFMEDFIDYYTEQLRLGVVVRHSEQLCQYDKMCVRKKLHLECPSDCKDDTRLLA